MKAKKKTVSKAKNNTSNKQLPNTRREPGAKYKSTKIEVLKRINEIVGLIIDNKQHDIVSYCVQNYKLNSTQIKKYKRAAYKKIEKITEKDIQKNLNKSLIQLDNKMNILENPMDWLNFFKERSKLLGLYPEKGNGEQNIIIETIDIEKLISEYK